MLDLPKAIKLLLGLYPEPHIEAREAAYIDHHAMIECSSRTRMIKP
jgi:hypothetical protein